MALTRNAGLENFTKAYTLDPHYAAAYAAAAEMYELLANNGAVDPAEAHPKAIFALTKALEIDPQSADNYRVLSIIRINEWKWKEAEEAIERAIALDPSYAKAHRQYTRLLASQGKFDASFESIKRAQSLDPLNLRLKDDEGIILVYSKRYDDALRIFHNIAGLEPNSLVDFERGWILALQGNYEESIFYFQKVSEATKDDVAIDCYLGYALARSGRHKEAHQLLKEVEASGRYVSPAVLAFFYIGFGDHETALDLLEKAYSKNDMQLKFLRTERIYDAIAAEPRFQQLVRAVGLSD